MEGIEKITRRIRDDAQEKVDAALESAKMQSQAISSDYQLRSDKAAQEILDAGKAQAAQRMERLVSAAQMEAGQTALHVRQELLQETFAMALQKLRNLPREEYVDFLARLLVKASATGQEKVIFNATDRAQVGKDTVTKANELLKDGRLTLSEETRPITGGFYLADGLVELNCTLEALVDEEKDALAAQVAHTLFPQ